MKHKYSFIFFFLFSSVVLAQPVEILMPQFNNSPGFERLEILCAAKFYDEGGRDGKYKFFNNAVLTICPTSTDQIITADIPFFSLMGGDSLKVFDGRTKDDPFLGFITNDIGGSGYFEASFENFSGCLTFTFYTTWSHGDDTQAVTSYDGWEADILCVPRLLEMGSPSDLYLNDDPSGDLIEEFNLKENDARIMQGRSSVLYAVSYHLTPAEAESGINPLPDLYRNTSSPQTLYARLEHLDTGTIDVEAFDLLVNPIPEPPLPELFELCDSDLDGGENIDLTNYAALLGQSSDERAFIFYDDPQDRVALSNEINQLYLAQDNPFKQIFYRYVDTTTGAYSYGEFGLQLDYIPELEPLADLTLCTDPSGQAVLNTKDINALFEAQGDYTISYHRSLGEAEAGTNALANNPLLSEGTEIFVRITTPASNCVYRDSFTVSLLPPLETSLEGGYTLCRYEDGSISGALVLDTGLSEEDYEFQWFLNNRPLPGEERGALEASEGGEYSVELYSKNQGCTLRLKSRIEEIPALSQFALQVDATPFDSNNVVRAVVAGGGTYEYVLNGQQTNSSGVFYGVPPGENTVVAIDPFGCTTLEQKFFIIGCPKYFSPNQDSVQDTWIVQGGEPVSIQRISIFNRFGRILAQLSGSEALNGWDGTFNGKPVLESSLWFKVEYTYLGEQQVSTGAFALIR